MGGAARSGDDDLDAARGRAGGVLGHECRGAVGGGDVDGGLDAEVVAEELEARNEGLEVAVGAHHHGDGGGGLRQARLGGLRLDVAALGADLVDNVDEGLDVFLGLLHRGRGDGDVAHLAARFGCALAVEVDAGVGDGESGLGGFEVGVRGGAADDVEHDGWLADFEALCGNGEVEDGAEVRFELGHCASFDRVVTRVVDAAGNFAQHDAVVFEEEHLHTERTLAVKGCDGLAGQLLGFLIDGVGDVASRCVDQLAYRIFLYCLDCGV